MWRVGVILFGFLIIGFGTAYSAEFNIKADKEYYKTNDTINFSIVTPVEKMFGDKHFIRLYGPDGIIKLIPVKSGVTAEQVNIQEIFRGDGTYRAEIAYQMGTKKEMGDIVSFIISDKAIPPPVTETMPPPTAISPVTEAIQGTENNVVNNLSNVENNMQEEITVFEFLLVIIILVILVVISIVVWKQYSKQKRTHHTKPVHNRNHNDNSSQSNLRGGIYSNYKNTKTLVQEPITSHPAKFNENKINANKPFEEDYSEIKKLDKSAIPRKGPIILDTSVLHMIHDNGISPGKTLERFIIPEQTEREFKSFYVKKCGGEKPYWYKDLRIEKKHNKKIKELVDDLYKKTMEDIDFVKEWVDKKQEQIMEKYEIDVNELKTDNDFKSVAEKLYRDSHRDRIIVSQAIAIIGDGEGCLMAQDFDITLFSKQIENLSAGKLKVVAAREGEITNLDER